MEDEKAVGRPRMMTLDWLMDKRCRITYKEAKEKA